MNSKEFTAAYLQILQEEHPEAKYTIIGDLSIEGDFNGKSFKHYLDNAYHEYKLAPKNLKEIVAKYIRPIVEFLEEPTPIKVEAIVPIIKPVDFLDSLRRMSRESGEEKEPWIVYETYNEQLIVVYAEDTPTSVRYFPASEFEKTGIPLSELRNLAVANLQRMLPAIEGQGVEGMYMLSAGGDYEASLILFEEIWSNPDNFAAAGQPVISIPNRDMILVTGSEEVDKMEIMKKITAEAYSNGHHSLSPYLYKWDGTHFVRFIPPADIANLN